MPAFAVCYITGGTPEGSAKAYPGCHNKAAIRGDQPITLPHQLYFADHSKAWNGAVAFIRRAASNATTHARMYLITYGQFNDVVRQENGRDVPGGMIVPPYADLANANEWQIERVRLYGSLIKIGTQDGHPILTFTTTSDDFVVGAPSEAYIKMIAAGLLETYPCLYKTGVLDYLAEAEGIHGAIDRERLAGWI